MKIYTLLLISILAANTAFAQFTSQDEYTGSWSDAASWLGSTAPDTNLNGKEDVTIDGYITLSGDLSVSTVLTINAADTLHIIGNLDVTGSGDIIVNGVLIVSGNYNGGGNSEVSNTGVVLIDGDLSTSGSGNITDPGNAFYVTGSQTGNVTNLKNGSDLSAEQPNLSNQFITPQPVELLTFEGYADGSIVQLAWITSMEENFDFFTVERAGADRNFKAIGTVKGQGNSTVEVAYNFVDETPLQGQALYRLKATDIDGTVEYHRIISVHFDGFASEDVRVYPNPVSSHQFKLVSRQDNISKIQLMDLSGRKVFSQEAQPGMTPVQLPSIIQPGTYILVVTGTYGEKYQQKIMVL